ncbi:MAG: ATP-dependent metallopeptidase FtsH/Yme1/Tma family protein, partial [Streptosporangiaceae bacterium]
MDLKRIFRGWMLAILLVFVLLIVVLKFVGSGPAYQTTNTSKVVHLIQSGQVKSANLIDTTQTIQVVTKGGQQYQSSWVGSQGFQLAQLLQTQANKGALPGGYNVQNPQGNSLLNVLISWLPFIVIFLR